MFTQEAVDQIVQSWVIYTKELRAQKQVAEHKAAVMQAELRKLKGRS